MKVSSGLNAKGGFPNHDMRDPRTKANAAPRTDPGLIAIGSFTRGSLNVELDPVFEYGLLYAIAQSCDIHRLFIITATKALRFVISTHG